STSGRATEFLPFPSHIRWDQLVTLHENGKRRTALSLRAEDGSIPGRVLFPRVLALDLPAHHEVRDPPVRGQRRRASKRLEHLVGGSHGHGASPVPLAYGLPAPPLWRFLARPHAHRLQWLSLSPLPGTEPADTRAGS